VDRPKWTTLISGPLSLLRRLAFLLPQLSSALGTEQKSKASDSGETFKTGPSLAAGVGTTSSAASYTSGPTTSCVGIWALRARKGARAYLIRGIVRVRGSSLLRLAVLPRVLRCFRERRELLRAWGNGVTWGTSPMRNCPPP